MKILFYLFIFKTPESITLYFDNCSVKGNPANSKSIVTAVLNEKLIDSCLLRWTKRYAFQDGIAKNIFFSQITAYFLEIDSKYF